MWVAIIWNIWNYKNKVFKNEWVYAKETFYLAPIKV